MASDSPLFRWETLRVVGPHTLAYREPVRGTVLDVEVVNGPRVNVFRADDGVMFFCHGLTFGGTAAPGGAVSPFSGASVLAILAAHYREVTPEAAAAPGDVLVWRDPDGGTPHSAVLVSPVVAPGDAALGPASLVRTKNGRLPEAVMTLDRLTGDEFEYGDSFGVYRRGV